MSLSAVRGSRLDWVIFLALGFMWGSSYLFIKIGVETLEPLTLVAGRLGIGAAILVAVALVAREALPRDTKTYGHLLVMSVLNIALPFVLITTAEQTTSSALAAIINGAVPLFVIVIAALALHDEPITVNRLVGLIVGFGGVVLLVSRGLGGSVEGAGLYGEIALIGSTIAYAIGGVYARRMVPGLRPVIAALFQVGFAFLITAGAALLLERPFGAAFNSDAIFAVVWLGIFGSGIAYMLWFRLLGRWGATRTSMVAYLMPVVGILLGFLVLNEQVDARILLGTALVIGGVALVNSRYGQRRLFGREPAPEAP